MIEKPNDFVKLIAHEHSTLKIKTSSNFSHLSTISSSSTLVEEVPDVALNFPVVFLKDVESGTFQLNSLLGLEAEENLFIDSEGKWNGIYMPSGVSLLPFMAYVDLSSDDYLRLDVNSSLVSKEVGTSLYSDGKPTEYLQSIQEQIVNISEGYLQTQRFTEELINKNLLCEFSIELKSSDGKISLIKDLYSINADEFSYLSEEDILHFHKLNYWSAIYLIQHSLKKFKDMLRLFNDKHPDRSISMSIKFNK